VTSKHDAADFRAFIGELRASGAQLGLDPELSAIEAIVDAQGPAKLISLRENIDRFFFGRGFSVIERLQARATEKGYTQIAAGLGQIKSDISSLFKGQFADYGNAMLPQSDMLRQMLGLFNDGKADDILAAIRKNLQHLDGHFFMILGEAMRNARSRRTTEGDFSVQVMTMIGRVVAEERQKASLPCSFGFLYRV
jgi:hypothetical protein